MGCGPSSRWYEERKEETNEKTRQNVKGDDRETSANY